MVSKVSLDQHGNRSERYSNSFVGGD